MGMMFRRPQTFHHIVDYKCVGRKCAESATPVGFANADMIVYQFLDRGR